MAETIEACNNWSTTGEFHGLRVVYGVTDSVFVMTPVAEVGDLKDALCNGTFRPCFGGSVNFCIHRVYATLLLIRGGARPSSQGK